MSPAPPHVLTILIVEDQDGPREVLATLLRPHYRVHSADSATAALRIVQDHRIDLIIQDIGLPDRNGIELLRDLQPLTDTKVIVISGAGTVQSAQDAIKLGAVAYLLKPFNTEELLVLVHKTLTPHAA
ncbi:response regulator [Nitrospira sp. NS4]|uniref:response regulator n=1 Tax=Nitrospira sp. NS4 TaxID=3414498 RepID=UPI003C2BF032